VETSGGDIAAQQVFFRLSIRALVAKIWSNKVVRWCPDGFFGDFLGPVFPSSHVQHTSDLHYKFALKPHHVSKYGIEIHSATAEISRGKKEDRKKPQDENIIACPIP